MSKTIYIKILLLLALALSAACEKERDIPSPAQEGQTVHYTATVQTGLTRATISEDMKYEFEAGDRVYLESEDQKLYGFLTLSVDGGVGKKEALFEGDLKYVGETPFERSSNPTVNLTLVSKEDKLHTVTAEGKLAPVESASYRFDGWAPSLEEAVSHLSHFTGSGHFNDSRFTLQQQSGFLKCFVRMYKTEAPVDREFTAKLLNNNNEQPFRQAKVTVSEAGSVPFVFAYLGGQLSLENAKLILEYEDSEMARFEGISGENLAANKYYSISRSTLSFKGFQIKAKYDKTTIRFNYDWYDSEIQYSLDYGETWTPYINQFELNANQVACIKGDRKGDNPNYKNTTNDDWGTPSNKPIFWASNLCYISGNIMSLLGDREELPAHAFHGAFSMGSSTAVTYIDIEEEAPLILPATELTAHCYQQMFRNCTRLTKAPALPATTSAISCYQSMFEGCTSLETPPSSLPITTVESSACNRMFFGCTKITTAPAFSNLLSIVKDSGCSEMFSGCTNMTTPPPSLPAGTLKYKAYYRMFCNCSKLESIPDFPHDPTVTYELTAGKSAENNQQDGLCYQMFYNCNALTSLEGKQLFNSITPLKLGCFNDMFSTCANLVEVPADFLPASTLAKSCYRGMFQQCKKLTRAPELLAPTLEQYCYRYMFFQCKSLVYIKCYSTSPGSSNTTQNWVKEANNAQGCEFHYRSGVNWPNGDHGVPNQWTMVPEQLN